VTEIERRETRGTVELRAAGPKGKRAGGYAMKFNTPSQNLGGFVERVMPSFPDQTLADGLDVLGRYQHDSNFLLGRTAAETLRLQKDGIGLDYEADLPDTSYARDLTALLERGDVRGSSFAFRLTEDGDSWGFTDRGFPQRDLHRGIIVDVAPVVTPAYLDTSSGLRSLAEHRSLDLQTVVAAAAHNELGDLLRAKEPVVIDLGPVQQRLRQVKLAMHDEREHLI
jgi:hypothetical protein